MDSLPNDIVDIITRKKFNLELLEHMKNLREFWGQHTSIRIDKYRREETFLVGDKVIYAKEYHYVVKVCEKSVVLDDGRRAKIDNVFHSGDYYIPHDQRFNKCNYIFDTGSVWCHPLVHKYPNIPECRETRSILSSGMVVCCDHPYAWVCFLIHNPNIEIKFNP